MVANVFSPHRTNAASRPLACDEEAGPTERRDDRRSLLSLTGIARGDSVDVRNGLIGAVMADDVNVERAAARAVLAEKVELHQAGAQLVLAGGDVSVHQGGAQAIVATGTVRLVQSGSGIAVGRTIDVGDRGTVVFALSPSLKTTRGRVVFGPLATVALFGGFAAAAVLVRRLLLRCRAG